MLTQEEYMDVLKLHHQGFTITEIADELGYHPATISQLDPRRRSTTNARARPVRAVHRRTSGQASRCLLEANPRLLATSVFEIIETEGFRAVIRRSLVTCAAFEDHGSPVRRRPPCRSRPHLGEECQFDWSDCSSSESCSVSASSTASGRSFPGRDGASGGSPPRSTSTTPWKASPRSMRPPVGCPTSHAPTAWVRSAAPGADALSSIRRAGLRPPARDGLCRLRARDAKRKGKIERPFRDLKESFLEELVLDPPKSVAEINARGEAFLANTGAQPAALDDGRRAEERLPLEAPMMAVLPGCASTPPISRCDGCIPSFPSSNGGACPTRCPPDALGQLVECRAATW